MTKLNKILLILIAFTFLLTACKKKLTPEEQQYVKRIEELRYQKNLNFISDPNSPFNTPKKVLFHPLNYFDVDPDYVFVSKLYRYENEDTVVIYGTKGEPRKTIRFGYLIIPFEGDEYKLNVYKSSSENGNIYYSIWFTDETTNEETYGVGRYLDFELNDDPDHIYTIDFNLAFNPFCAYNPAYSCAIPRKEDHLPFAVRAGEKKFHD